MPATRFDRAYYDRFYRDPRTRVASREETARLARFVCAYVGFLELPLRHVLDLGCGLGAWRDALAVCAPKARYTGVEYSEYLCDELGWEHGSVVDYHSDRAFDLVVCQGVLQYLGDRDAGRALHNLAGLCQGALFLEVLTRADWERNCDRRRTDGDVHLRTGRWYRTRLRPHFVNIGGGVFVHRGAGLRHFELETLDGGG
ncbi:MAG: class I SAM-dependent methyltransferase [Planctomycetes bacterium]|nr:class I SAM-dependent methyltransferase [Planctomycetota bacterium]